MYSSFCRIFFYQCVNILGIMGIPLPTFGGVCSTDKTKIAFFQFLDAVFPNDPLIR